MIVMVIVIMILITMIAMMIIIIIVMIILTIIMVEVLSNLQFNFHHKLPLESLSKWLKSLLIETEKNDKKLTKIDEIYQDSENPVQSRPRLHQLVKTNPK